jgi:hypothetical protein
MDFDHARAVAAKFLAMWFTPDMVRDVKESDQWRMSAPTRDEYLYWKREFDEADAEGRRQLKNRFIIGDPTLEGIIADARQGGVSSHFTLWDCALGLTACAEPLLSLLQEYMAVDAPAFRRRPGRQGRSLGAGHEVAGIASIVALLAKNGLNPYRNREPRSGTAPPTACSIVAEELRRVGIIKTEAAVEKIFEQDRFRESGARIAEVFVRRGPTLVRR